MNTPARALRWLPLIALALALAAPARADFRFKEPFARAGSFAPAGEVSLENVNGHVTVRTWHRNEIRIEGEKSAATEDELRAIELTMDVDETRAAIKVRLPKRSGRWFGGDTIRAAVTFTLTVPAGAVLEKVSTVNAPITLEDLTGPVNARSVNGHIHAAGLAAGARLHTVNGGIEADFTRLQAGQELSVETVNGGIKIRVPADAGATVRARVVNGHVSCDLPLTLHGKNSGRSLNGTIGDGRARLSLEAVNGSIHLASLPAAVER